MSATNSTLNYQLPQFIATDKPAWLVDFNGAMSDIDTAIKEAKTAGDNAQSTANTNAVNIQTLDGTVTSQGTAIGTLSDATTAHTGSINTINSLIGNGQPTTTDKTLIGAINEIYGMITGGGGQEIQAANVSYDNTTSGLTATSVQAAIDEVKNDIPANAAAVPYSNTSSGLTATNVQAAIDELAQGGSVGYDFKDVVITKTVSGSTTVSAEAITTEVNTGAPSGYEPSHAIRIAAAGQSTVASVFLGSDDNWYASFICGGSASVTLSITMRYVKATV